jgi:hypothetical protein
MPAKIEVKTRDAAIKDERNKLADRVLKVSAFQPPIDMRLLAFFDDEDAGCFKNEFGSENRGGFFPTKDEMGTPLSREYLRREKWPEYLVDLLFTPNISPSMSSGDREILSFGGLTYLHDSTCVNPTALVMTFAHELQHSFQYERTPRLWCDNDRLKKHRALKLYKIPAEREARVVAKRVAEELCGVDVVSEYIRQKILDARQKKAIDEVRDWRWIEQYDSTKMYCLQSETEKAVRKMNRFCNTQQAPLS